jgi:hypothetical protein
VSDGERSRTVSEGAWAVFVRGGGRGEHFGPESSETRLAASNVFPFSRKGMAPLACSAKPHRALSHHQSELKSIEV